MASQSDTFFARFHTMKQIGLLFFVAAAFLPLEAGLIGYWTLDGNVEDSIGGHPGVLHNAHFSSEAKVGSHSVFFGKNDLNRCVDLGNWDPSDDALTLSLWVKPERGGQGHQILIAKRKAWEEGALRWQLVYQSPRKHGETTSSRSELIRFETTSSRAEFICKLVPGKWSHIGLTREGETGVTRLYIDGVAVGGEEQRMQLGSPIDAPLVVGGGHPGDWKEAFDGSIDDVAIWSEALSLVQIDQLVQGVSPSQVASKNVALRSPEAEQASFQFADPDLRIQLIAAEPDVESPVAMAFTPDGSLYVAEMPGYPTTEWTGRVKKLNDEDGDGRYTMTSVFADGLNFPNSVMPFKGGLLVTDAPDIFYLKDTTGDGKADHKEVVYTGYRPGNEQLRVNSLYWGLDNWIYGANGRSGGEVIRFGEEEPVSINSRDFRFRPDFSDFQAITGMSQYGQAHDDWGNRFLPVNYLFARHVLLEERHLERNPYLSSESVHATYQSEHDRRVYTLVHDTARFNRDPIGYFTSLSGLTAYRGHLLGPDYDGDLFAGESVQAAVVHRRMTPDGPTFKAVDTNPGKEFLASTDGWFHPVNFANGPDGALYLVDFYRQYVEHPQWAHQDKKEGIDWEVGQEHGRLWRISHKDTDWNTDQMQLDLEQMDAKSLVQQLQSPASWRRETAQRILIENQQSDAEQDLIALLEEGHSRSRVHALWTLEGLGQLEDDRLMKVLADADPLVQTQGVKLAERRLPSVPELKAKVLELVQSEDGGLRYHAILALGTETSEAVKRTLLECASSYDDRWTRLALLSSAASWADRFALDLLKQKKVLDQVDTETIGFLKDVGAMVAGRRVTMDFQQLNGSPAELAVVAGYMLNSQSSGDESLSLPPRIIDQALKLVKGTPAQHVAQVGLDLLRFSDEPKTGEDLVELVLNAENDEMRIGALNIVAAIDRSELSGKLFANLNAMNPAVRKAQIISSLSSTAAANALLESIREGNIDRAEIPEELRQGLLQHPNSPLKEKAVAILASAVDEDRQALVDHYLSALDSQAVDLKAGAKIFATNCASCHAVSGFGGKLAPDLTIIGSRSDEVLLISILDPSRMVSHELRLRVIVTKNNEVISGTIASETTSSITIRLPDGTEKTVLRDNIQTQTTTDQSIMPEGFERSIDEAGMASLLGFLRNPDPILFE